MDNVLHNTIPITIISPTLKKGKNDVRNFNAILSVENGVRTYFVTETKSSIDRKRFDLVPGSIIMDSSGSYTCNEVKFCSSLRRIYPVIYA